MSDAARGLNASRRMERAASVLDAESPEVFFGDPRAETSVSEGMGRRSGEDRGLLGVGATFRNNELLTAMPVEQRVAISAKE